MSPRQRADCDLYSLFSQSDPVGGDSNDRFSSRLKHIVSVLHLFIISELGCASRASEIRRNDMKEKSNQPHYG